MHYESLCNYSIWVQLLDRRQQRLELVLLSVDNFTEPPPNMYNVENSLNPPTPAVQVIYTQYSDIWINVSSYRNSTQQFSRPLYCIYKSHPSCCGVVWKCTPVAGIAQSIKQKVSIPSKRVRLYLSIP